MARRSSTEKVLSVLANVTSAASPFTVISVPPGYIASIKEVYLSNAGASNANVTLKCGTNDITKVVVAPSSNTRLNLQDIECGKGEDVIVTTDNTVDLTLLYVLHDKTDPITKSQARFNTYNNVFVTRAPSKVQGHNES